MPVRNLRITRYVTAQRTSSLSIEARCPCVLQDKIFNIKQYIKRRAAMEHNRLKFIFGAIVIFAFVSGTAAQQEVINICQNVSDNIFLTDISNCSNYFICVGGQPIPQHCDNARYFNGETQSCDVTSTSCLTCGANEVSFSSFPRTCNKYFMCFAGNFIVRQCADNLQFNPTTKLCDLPTNVDCVSNKCPIQNNVNNIIYIPSAAACNKYYICLSGTPQKQNCSGTLQFSTKCNCCDLPSVVGCSIKPLSRRSTDPFPQPPEAANFECPSTGTHFYPHKNLNRYYVCSDGKSVILSCAQGLYYDPKAKECRELKNIRFA